MTPDLEAIEVLTQAKERIFEHGWGVGTIPRRDADPESKGTYCLEDGLCGRGKWVNCLRDGDPAKRAAKYVNEVVRNPHHELYIWNDCNARSAGEVMDALDAAILVAKDTSELHSSDIS